MFHWCSRLFTVAWSVRRHYRSTNSGVKLSNTTTWNPHVNLLHLLLEASVVNAVTTHNLLWRLVYCSCQQCFIFCSPSCRWLFMAFKACMALSDTLASCHTQEVHLHGNDMGNEGIRELMAGLMAHKGMTHTYTRLNFCIQWVGHKWIHPS